MDLSQNSLESLITNPGFEHIGIKILMDLSKKNLLNLRLVSHSFKFFVDNPRFLFKRLKFGSTGIRTRNKRSRSMALQEVWSNLIRKVEEKNYELEKNVKLNLIRMVNKPYCVRNFFPLNVFSGFGDLSMVQFIIENNMVERYVFS